MATATTAKFGWSGAAIPGLVQDIFGVWCSRDNWGQLDQAHWLYANQGLTTFLPVSAGKRVDIGIALIPHNTDFNPLSTWDSLLDQVVSNASVLLAPGGSTYKNTDDIFYSMGVKLAGFTPAGGTCYGRLFWEMNQNFSSGYITRSKFIAAWNRAVPKIRAGFASVANGKTLKIVFCPISDGADYRTFYPDNSNVDIIALDPYATKWGTSVPTATDLINTVSGYLNALATFAQSKGKPLALGEFGNWQTNASNTTSATSHGRGDFPEYIDLVFDWVDLQKNTSSPVEYVVYYNINDSNNTGIDLSNTPLSLARLKKRVLGDQLMGFLDYIKANSGLPSTSSLADHEAAFFGGSGSLADRALTYFGGTGSLADRRRAWLVAQTGKADGTLADLEAYYVGGSSTLSNTGVPTVSGTAQVGQVLSAATGSWSAAPDSYAYQWLRAGVAISGATASTYTAVTADLGNVLSVQVTAAKSGFLSATATSAATASVVNSATPSYFLSDDFVGTDGSDINGRISSGAGGQWVRTTTNTLSAAIQGNKVASTSVGSGYYTAGAPGGADYTVEADLIVGSAIIAGQNFGVVSRAISSQAPTPVITYYGFRYNVTTNQWAIVKQVNGAGSVIGTPLVQALALNSVVRMKLVVSGDSTRNPGVGATLTAYLNGTQIDRTTDTSLASAGQPGFSLGFGVNGAGTGLFIDNIAAY